MNAIGIILAVTVVACLAVVIAWLIVDMVWTIKDRRNEK